MLYLYILHVRSFILILVTCTVETKLRNMCISLCSCGLKILTGHQAAGEQAQGDSRQKKNTTKCWIFSSYWHIFNAPYVTVNDLAVQAEALRDVERRQRVQKVSSMVKPFESRSGKSSHFATWVTLSQDVATMYFESHQNQGFLVVVAERSDLKSLEMWTWPMTAVESCKMPLAWELLHWDRWWSLLWPMSVHLSHALLIMRIQQIYAIFNIWCLWYSMLWYFVISCDHIYHYHIHNMIFSYDILICYYHKICRLSCSRLNRTSEVWLLHPDILAKSWCSAARLVQVRMTAESRRDCVGMDLFCWFCYINLYLVNTFVHTSDADVSVYDNSCFICSGSGVKCLVTHGDTQGASWCCRWSQESAVENRF